MALCTICGDEVVLVPSAAERARRYGGKPHDYTKIFDAHSQCIVDARNEQVAKLMARVRQT